MTKLWMSVLIFCSFIIVPVCLYIIYCQLTTSLASVDDDEQSDVENCEYNDDEIEQKSENDYSTNLDDNKKNENILRLNYDSSEKNFIQENVMKNTHNHDNFSNNKKSSNFSDKNFNHNYSNYLDDKFFNV
jgi:hypothetical protein